MPSQRLIELTIVTQMKIIDKLSSVINYLCRERKADLLRAGRWCNGASEFCNLRVDEFLWPGTHNAGTGQSQGGR